jgi:hypothetical protein
MDARRGRVVAQFEQRVDERRDVDTEDSGCAKIAHICTHKDKKEDEENGLFVRIQSWSELAHHPEFEELVGKKVRVTIEILEEVEDQLPPEKKEQWEDLKTTLKDGAARAFGVDPSEVEVSLEVDEEEN